MCFSATVSYSASAVLVTTGLYAVQQARWQQLPYWLLALVPVLFGIQQGFEGRVWQEIDAGRASAAVPYALGFHFFSHFLWLWWFPLCSTLLERGKIRRRVFLGLGIFGAFAGGLVYFTILFHPDWMAVAVREHSIVYRVSSTYRGPVSIPIPASALYVLVVLVPLLFSSHRHIRIFGGLVALSVVLASVAYGYAFVSVWCFFAAVLSLYIVYMIRKLKGGGSFSGT
jgi:hypothetical protein